MGKFGETLKAGRIKKRISFKKASNDLAIKIEHLMALESETWQELPEPTFVKGFITSYAVYLGLDPQKLQALYRREFDERKYPKKTISAETKKRLYLTPSRLINLIFALAILTFVAYLTLQYSSILSAPRVDITSPGDDETTSVPVIIIKGNTEKDTTVSVNGQFVPIDEEGKFTYQYTLTEGKNTIEIVAAKRLSPKSRITRTIRLVR
ncbi:hypothetical protein A3A60_01830 [Candidatus Curtissbacteria bacterium RIFCSPLOWO2_01_FULL_42_26]|uniref:DUF4115 domain-containing protein n=1 Tax=Candidatus Curtissbacteria bacterium RIFCSPLOWO2_01_FULL_42_26 TaxID=1797729 RepID=A0A1F5I1K3_9BACT|nr:MAG: hypothetical protein A3A60_01830 [Candidatus Curtissbacteria bacterium RIFCSPLOWO2_01_FULL_42_26]